MQDWEIDYNNCHPKEKSAKKIIGGALNVLRLAFLRFYVRFSLKPQGIISGCKR